MMYWTLATVLALPCVFSWQGSNMDESYSMRRSGRWPQSMDSSYSSSRHYMPQSSYNRYGSQSQMGQSYSPDWQNSFGSKHMQDGYGYNGYKRNSMNYGSGNSMNRRRHSSYSPSFSSSYKQQGYGGFNRYNRHSRPMHSRYGNNMRYGNNGYNSGRSSWKHDGQRRNSMSGSYGQRGHYGRSRQFGNRYNQRMQRSMYGNRRDSRIHDSNYWGKSSRQGMKYDGQHRSHGYSHSEPDMYGHKDMQKSWLGSLWDFATGKWGHEDRHHSMHHKPQHWRHSQQMNKMNKRGSGYDYWSATEAQRYSRQRRAREHGQRGLYGHSRGMYGNRRGQYGRHRGMSGRRYGRSMSYGNQWNRGNKWSGNNWRGNRKSNNMRGYNYYGSKYSRRQ